jgi:hypothetical protein
MTKLLDEAIDQLRELPDEEQDAAADALFAYMSNDDRVYSLRPDQVADVQRIRDGLAAGKTRLATEGQVGVLRNMKRA